MNRLPAMPRCLSLSALFSVLVLCFGFGFASESQADVRVPGFFGDHMVLQQKMPLKVWGWGAAGENVSVTLGSDTVETQCDKQGRWQVSLPARPASKVPTTLTIQGNNKIEFNDILIGEVWLCSGQSNMEWTVERSANAQEEIANANHPLIRQVKFEKVPSAIAREDIKADWKICSPETVARFTAVGYFTAVNLQKELDVPIGLISSSWGGTRVEPWTPVAGFAQVPKLADLHAQVENRTPGSDSYTKAVNQHRQLIAQWLVQSQESVQARNAVAAHPPFPAQLAPLSGRQDPTALYNGMIHALVGFPIRGALWYQGEANRLDGQMYFEKKKALIGGWRQLWGQGDFPFYFVQIAPYQYGKENPELLAEFWEAQEDTLQVPNTGMVVVNDIGNIRDIHPRNKQDVGKRMALLALRHTYGRDDIVADSPSVAAMQTNGNKLTVQFKDTGGGLKTRDGKAPSHFEVVGAGSGGFQPANATIDGDSVVLSSPDVASPSAFRFAWHKTAEPNLMGGTGLPVGAARGGKVPSFMDSLTEDDEYQLVYEVDLSELARPVQYSVDNSDSVPSFDRVAYWVQLNSSEHGQQELFVSMDAFTEDIKKIGIPDNATFQTTVTGMNVYCTDRTIVQGTNLAQGSIEFWPNNYAPENAGKIKGATDARYDFGDAINEVTPGYGSMQVHNTAAKQTLFAINNWRIGNEADIGIGNSAGPHWDWTFTKSGSRYTSKRLRVFVRPKK